MKTKKLFFLCVCLGAMFTHSQLMAKVSDYNETTGDHTSTGSGHSSSDSGSTTSTTTESESGSQSQTSEASRVCSGESSGVQGMVQKASCLKCYETCETQQASCEDACAENSYFDEYKKIYNEAGCDGVSATEDSVQAYSACAQIKNKRAKAKTGYNSCMASCDSAASSCTSSCTL